MDSPASFRLDDNWNGGVYELAMELGTVDDAHLQAVLEAVWSAAEIDGCYGRRDLEPEEQDPVPLTVDSLTRFGDNLMGHVRLPTGALVIAGCMAVRGGGGCDWLDFYVPIGALANAGVDLWADPRPMTRSLDLEDWFADIGRRVFDLAHFDLGLIGHEASGQTSAEYLAGRVPEKRGGAYLIPQPDGVRYYPTND